MLTVAWLNSSRVQLTCFGLGMRRSKGWAGIRSYGFET